MHSIPITVPHTRVHLPPSYIHSTHHIHTHNSTPPTVTDKVTYKQHTNTYTTVHLLQWLTYKHSTCHIHTHNSTPPMMTYIQTQHMSHPYTQQYTSHNDLHTNIAHVTSIHTTVHLPWWLTYKHSTPSHIIYYIHTQQYTSHNDLHTNTSSSHAHILHSDTHTHTHTHQYTSHNDLDTNITHHHTHTHTQQYTSHDDLHTNTAPHHIHVLKHIIKKPVYTSKI